MGDYPDYTDLVQLVGSDIIVPINIQTQSITLAMDIVAQTVGNIGIDIKAQTLAELNVNIIASAVTLNINIASQTVNLNVNILSCVATINVSGTVNVAIGTVETLSNITHIAGAKDIDMGMPAIDRPAREGPDITLIDAENPADASGIIDTVEIWAYAKLTGCKVGIFQKTGANKFRCRSVAYLGTVAAGSKQTFDNLDLDVRMGDFIAIYFSGGSIDESALDEVTYPKGCYGTWGDILTPGLETDGIDHAPGRALSLHAFATLYPLKVETTYTGVTYVKSNTATTDAARRFETSQKFLRDVLIQVATNDQLFGTSAAQTFPVVQGDRFSITQIDISTLYFKNAVAGQNGTVHILAVLN